jgi:hypothetical protein
LKNGSAPLAYILTLLGVLSCDPPIRLNDLIVTDEMKGMESSSSGSPSALIKQGSVCKRSDHGLNTFLPESAKNTKPKNSKSAEMHALIKTCGNNDYAIMT